MLVCDRELVAKRRTRRIGAAAEQRREPDVSLHERDDVGIAGLEREVERVTLQLLGTLVRVLAQRGHPGGRQQPGRS